MHPKLFASLLEAIEKWSNENCETQEWSNDSPLWPDNADLKMAEAAAAVYDVIVSTTKAVEAEHA